MKGYATSSRQQAATSQRRDADTFMLVEVGRAHRSEQDCYHYSALHQVRGGVDT